MIRPNSQIWVTAPKLSGDQMITPTITEHPLAYAVYTVREEEAGLVNRHGDILPWLRVQIEAMTYEIEKIGADITKAEWEVKMPLAWSL